MFIYLLKRVEIVIFLYIFVIVLVKRFVIDNIFILFIFFLGGSGMVFSIISFLIGDCCIFLIVGLDKIGCV